MQKLYNQYKVKLGLNRFVPEDIFTLIEDYSNKMFLPDIIKQKAIKTAENYIKNNKPSGKNLTAIAGVCIYLSGLFYQSGITQNEITMFTGISTTTIRRRTKDIKNYLPLDDIDFI
jgi:transcription initiation factor TFIIIB Brf1 subunit/transcription initiation factor TFIIB